MKESQVDVNHESSAHVGELGEFDLIRRISSIVGKSNVPVGIGDDAAVLEGTRENYLLVTVDMCVQDVHFRLETTSAEDLGGRIVGVNASDIAAMGGIPEYAVSSIAIPDGITGDFIEATYSGMVEAGSKYGIQMVGGNISKTSGPLVLDMTLLGTVPKDEVVLRSGARPGDFLAVTGTLGAAAAARYVRESDWGRMNDSTTAWLRSHVVPQPRVDAGRMIAGERWATAMMDLSDGLSGDIFRLCHASRVGAVIREADLPISRHLRAVAANLPMSALDLALSGGEDYELLLTLPREAAETAVERLPLPLTIIGWVTHAQDGVRMLGADGVLRQLQPSGWRHM